MTVHLGYMNTGDLRRFAMCPITLQSYNLLRENATKMRPENVLELIRDSAVDAPIIPSLPSDMSMPWMEPSPELYIQLDY